MNTLNNRNKVKLFTENSAMARLRDILRGWEPADPEIHSNETQLEANNRPYNAPGLITDQRVRMIEE